MNMIIPINTPEAPSAIGPYSQGIVYTKANLIFVSGQLPILPSTGNLLQGDIKTLTRQTLKNIAAILQEGKSNLNLVLSVDVFLTDLDDFQAMNEAYAEFFATPPCPARKTVQVAGLPKGSPIEIACIAAII